MKRFKILNSHSLEIIPPSLIVVVALCFKFFTSEFHKNSKNFPQFALMASFLSFVAYGLILYFLRSKGTENMTGIQRFRIIFGFVVSFVGTVYAIINGALF